MLLLTDRPKLYAIGRDRSAPNAPILYSVYVREIQEDPDCGPTSWRLYETIEDHKEYFGRRGTKWYDDGHDTSTDIHELIRHRITARVRDMNNYLSSVNILRDGILKLKDLDKQHVLQSPTA